MNNIKNYIDALNRRYQLGNATEHTFRGDLAILIEQLVPNIVATNEPKRQACGAPDYILTKKSIPIGYIEAKDIGDNDLEGKKKSGNKEQFDRYKAQLNNIVFTDYLDFYFYQNGELITSIRIGQIIGKKIIAISEKFELFSSTIRSFTEYVGQDITSPQKLAQMMANKAKLLANTIEKSLNNDSQNEQDSTLKNHLDSFQQILIHDINAKGFADVYAQTIAYGLFAARLHDTTLESFSRQEAAELIPKTNPFLRKLFGYIAGPEIDDRIKWVVDDLADIFLHCNVSEILKSYGRSTKTESPIIHFYETFLSEYDPNLRKSRGVWYTPAPVVDFIVRAVDEVLKTDFGLKKGLADNSKIKITHNVPTKDGRYKDGYIKAEKEVHKVQILDPATGTGTFLAQVVKHVEKSYTKQKGMWSNYVEEHLIPRLNGFELLMASYAMAHLQLDLLLRETGYQAQNSKRFKVYLTNSLEESHPDTGTLFASWLSNEANEANHIKRDTPVMCVIGNPPYSGESANKGDWIMGLMEDYKKEPNSTERLQERNPKWINDDYVKFIRYGQYFIEKNGSGILAYINPHGFLDNPTFRGVRWSLLKAFDKIYTLDLHGNAKKKETAPDGSIDQNVFDIMQGVSITLFIKTGQKKPNELGKVFHYDLYGKREDKYQFLLNNSLATIPYVEIPNKAPMYFMVQKDFELENAYIKGFQINDLFLINNVGIVTSRDSFIIDEDKDNLKKRMTDFIMLNKNELHILYGLKENGSWKIDEVKKKIQQFEEKYIREVAYRPFDSRFIYYHENMIERSRKDVMRHFLHGDNVGLITSRTVNSPNGWYDIQVTKFMTEFGIMATRVGNGAPIMPLYLYSESDITQEKTRTPNFKADIIKKIEKSLGLNLQEESDTKQQDNKKTFSPLNLLDYIYAVLHSPIYRETYKEFLKIDFPRVPYPKDKLKFWQLVKLGEQLRQIHLLEHPNSEDFETSYPIDGDNIIEKPYFSENKIYINESQYIENVTENTWNFYIGGYQPAQKWLKDRKRRSLGIDELTHYQKILKALADTERLMTEVDKIVH